MVWRLGCAPAIFAIATAVTGCGGDTSDNDHGGGASSSGGRSSGGSPSSGGSGDVSAGALAGRSGGGHGGHGADGGASGAGPIIVPPRPGISCGEATCDEGSEVCCLDSSSYSCMSFCSGGVVRVGCDDSADCPGGVCCFAGVLESAFMATHCETDCGDFMVEVCAKSSDCGNGDACHAYRCSVPGDATASVIFGLCTDTTPSFCE